MANADSSTRRQSTTDKAASAAKPDSQKSVLEQGQDQAKSAADTVGGTIQPGTFSSVELSMVINGANASSRE